MNHPTTTIKELVSGEIFKVEDVKIIKLNLDQLKYDYSNSYFSETYNNVIDSKILEEENVNLDWHENNSRSIPFIVGEDCLYEAEYCDE